MNRTIDLLNKIDEEVGLNKHADRCVRFMVESCILIKDRLSDSGTSALVVAQRYWAGLATENELEAARVECWQELDAKSWSTNTEEPEACAMRAVICVLYPRWVERDALEHMEWFMQMSNRAEDHWIEQYNLLHSLFSDTLHVHN
ncbi:hypothetical protein WMF20_45890 [Sorangium sp. So ce834]|uniref:hypothetical protein n=1 Tax=Sorangium sp. So ce834 TaxID=3133321 RepID=UPI003F608222